MKKAATRSRASTTKSAPTRQTKVLGYSERADRYARQVLDETILACKWVKLACQRHFDDLERSKSKDWHYRFDPAKANRACRFAEAMPHTKGEWAGRHETLKLEPFQCLILCSLFGWVDKVSGNYRFWEAYICLSRKNGKSALAAVIGNYKFAADGDYGAEVFSGATTEKQAWEVFRPAKLMAERTPEFRTQFGVTVNAKSLTIPGNGSRFEPVIGKPGDGASPSCAIVDEYHEHSDDSLYDTMKTGMGARQNPLLLVITTAGSDRSGPCYALQVDAQKVLEGKIQNDRLFVLIYTIDETDQWMSEEALVKANPNFGVSVSAEFLRNAQRDAVNSARKQNVFKTKHLNVWVNAAVAWMNMVAWDACADPNLKLEEFERQECWDGLDLASRKDIASKVKLFRRVIDGKVHFYAFADHYLNEDAAANGIHYQGWANEGRLVITPGNVTDLNWIADGLIDDVKRFIVREIPHDPYQSEPLLQTMRARPDWNENVLLVALDANVKNFSAPMKELEALVLAKRFHHDGDPILGWMVSNVVCHQDAKDNIYPRKERDENKIDGAVALIMALNRALTMPEPFQSVYSTRGIRTL